MCHSETWAMEETAVAKMARADARERMASKEIWRRCQGIVVGSRGKLSKGFPSGGYASIWRCQVNTSEVERAHSLANECSWSSECRWERGRRLQCRLLKRSVSSSEVGKQTAMASIVGLSLIATYNLPPCRSCSCFEETKF